METNELRAALEAILFVSSDPVKVDDLGESFPDEGKDAVAAQLEEIKRTLDEHVGGFALEQAAGGWRFVTRPEHDSVLRKYFSKKGENRLSLAALETLAIVAYRQPITAPEVSDIRGVNSTAVIRTLLERRMVRVSGRKNVVGSPFLYRTTKEFLVHFGLNDIRDLPRLEEFGDLIGENINDDLVAAINSAEESEASPASGEEELPTDDMDRDDSETTAAEAAVAPLESGGASLASSDDELSTDDMDHDDAETTAAKAAVAPLESGGASPASGDDELSTDDMDRDDAETTAAEAAVAPLESGGASPASGDDEMATEANADDEAPNADDTQLESNEE